MKKWIEGGAWALLAGTPWFAIAAGTGHPAGHGGQAAFLIAANGDLPLSKDALFDVAPEAEKAGGAAPKAGKAAEEAPASKESLFDLAPMDDKAPETAASPAKSPESPSAPPPSAAGVPPEAPAAAEPPESKEALFGDGAPAPKPEAPAALPVQGFFQAELAHTYADPSHRSKTLGRLELGTQGSFRQGVRWKLSGRLDYNAKYDRYEGLGSDARHAEFKLRENYLDFSAGAWDYRIGRQHIVWGEMVGIFVADVVSAKDLRDFVLPDFQVLRIPQWAARAEYFEGDFHAELVWIPFPSYDRIGKQGAEFFPYPPSPAPIINPEEKPGYRLDNTNFGVRLSQLTNGWDLAGFYYRSTDSQQTFYRDATLVNFFPRHDRIWQAGGTLAKDLGPFVLKGEGVYTHGRHFNVTNLTDADGVVAQNTLDWAVGLDFNPTVDTRVNTQFYQRVYFDHDPDIVQEGVENGFSLLVNYKFPRNWEAEALLVRSLNRDDWMLRPKVSWGFERNWRLVLGLDVFHGPSTGIFGQYDQNDRGYAELRYDF